MNMFRKVLRVLCACGIFLLAPTAQAGPSYEVFGESLNANGWSSQPWGATVTAATTPVFRGSKSAKVVYTSAMGVFKQVASGGFKTTGYKHLTFAVYNSSNADDLWLVAQTTEGTLGTYLRVADYADRWGTPQGKWTWVRIPISDLGLGSVPTLAYFSVASGRPATAYFDDVGFAASSVLYEGMASTSASSHAYGPGIQFWYWNANRSYYKSGSNYWMKITPTSSTNWAGVQFQHRDGDLNTSDYGAIAIRFRPGNLIMSNQYMLTLTDRNGSLMGITVTLDGQYLPAGVTFESGEWYHMTIPMSDFGISSQYVGGVAIETGSGESFSVDDVRLVQKLSRPLLGEWRVNDAFGSHWQSEYCGSDVGLPDLDNPKLHTGTDYRAPSVTKVYASSRGFVRQSGTLSGGWGKYIVVQHEGGLATSYLHTDMLTGLTLGSEVQRGQQIGSASPIPAPHLHFGVRLQDVLSTTDYVARAGALTKNGCTIDGAIYPAFSDRFIDSGMFDGF